MRSLQLVLTCLAASAVSVISQTQQPLLSKPTPPEVDSSIPNTPLFSFHRTLTNISSLTSHEQEAGAFLSSYLHKELGLKITTIPVPDDPSRYSIFAYPGPDLPSVILSSHYDTVPPFYPYAYNATTGVISGRGSVDAKAAVAAQTIALSELRRSHKVRDEVGLLFVVGEETDGIGMKTASTWFHARNITFAAVIFGEPTEQKLVCGHKGITLVTLRAKGKAAHSGYPWLGVSATQMLVRALAAIDALADAGRLGHSPKFGVTTANLGLLAGGVANNVVAEDAEAGITVRIAAGTPQQVQAAIWGAALDATAALRAHGGALAMDISPNMYAPVDIDCAVDGFDTMTVNYGTDVPNLTGPHRRFLYGPGTIFVAHSDHEALLASELQSAVGAYKRLTLAALGR